MFRAVINKYMFLFLIFRNAAIYLLIQVLQLQIIRHFFYMKEITFTNI